MEIKNFKMVNKGNIIAVFDVKFNEDIEIFGFKLAKEKKGGEFVGMKSVKNFKNEWESIGKMSKKMSDKIRDKVKEMMPVEGEGV